MVEQRSSKPHAWVRFLLSLFLMLFKLTRQTKKIPKVQSSRRRLNLFKYRIKRLNRTAPKVAKFVRMPKIGTWVQRSKTRPIIRTNKHRMSNWYKRVPFGATHIARYVSRAGSGSVKLRKHGANFHSKRAFSSKTFVWSSEKVFSHSHLHLVSSPALFAVPLHSCTSSVVKSSSAFTLQFTKKLWTWLSENATTPYLLNLTKATHTPTLNPFSDQLFFRNNLNSLVNTGAGSLSSYKKRTSYSKSPSSNSFNLKDKNYRKLVRKFLLGDVHTTRFLKQFYLKVRKARVHVNEIPSTLFFSAGVIRVSHALTKMESRVNVTKYKRERRHLTYRGLVAFFTLLTSGQSRPKLLSRKDLRLKARHLRFTRPARLSEKSSLSSNSVGSNFLLRDGRFASSLTTNTLLTKALYLDRALLSGSISPTSSQREARNRTLSLDSLTFSSRSSSLAKLNLIPAQVFKFALKRKLLRILSFHKFSSNITLWYYNTLIRFIESCSGKKVYTKFNPFIENSLAFEDLARCNLWHSRITAFQRLLGPKIFLKESLKILHIAIKFKDPTFFANWIKGMLYRMSFWKYRLLFRYIKYAMRYLFWLHFPRLGFKGLKLRLKGKISVAGNARTRTLLYKIGETGYSKFNNRVVSDYSTINTFTGVLGFKVWFFF